MGFLVKGGPWGGRILILDQYAERIVITNHHTKFQPDSSKRLEVIQSWNVKKSGDRQTDRQTDDTHPGKNYSRRRNLFRRRQKETDGPTDSYKDSDEEGKASESMSSFQGVTPAEDAAFENAFLDGAAWTPLPDAAPI